MTATFDADNQTVTADVSMQADGGASGGGVPYAVWRPGIWGHVEPLLTTRTFLRTQRRIQLLVFTDNGAIAVLRSASAELKSGGEIFCNDCSFLRWGSWNTHLVFDSGGSGQGNSNVFGHGWWIAGDIIDQSDMPTDGSATYSGRAIADVASNLDDMGWVTYTAKGDMVMTWDFGARGGDLTISKFDTQHIDGGLTFTRKHDSPPGDVGFNQFGGTLSGKDLPDNLSDLSGVGQRLLRAWSGQFQRWQAQLQECAAGRDWQLDRRLG